MGVLEMLLEDKNCPSTIQKLNLTFEGFDDMFKEFCSLKESDSEKFWSLSLTAVAWQDYFSSMMSTVGYVVKNLETEKARIISEAIKATGEKTMTKAERLSKQNPDVIQICNEIAIAEAVYDLLDSKTKILDKVHYFCREAVYKPDRK